MKVFIPKHIQWWFFNMNLSLWPLNINLIQLFILAWWMAISLGLWNAINKATWQKVLAAILVAPIMIIFLVIAFFRYSELPLVPFVAKIIRTYFLDETRKYQVNYAKADRCEIAAKILKSWEKKQIVESKERNFDEDKLKQFDQFLD